MVIGAPRSGTAWAAAWLGAIHDPLWDHYYEDLPKEIDGGISCTGLSLFPDWVNQQRCPKVVLHRPINECEASLRREKLPSPPPVVYRNLDRIRAVHVPWTDLFEKPQAIWEHLKRTPFDPRRHDLLREVNIQSDWIARKINANPSVRDRMRKRGVVVAR